MLLYEWVKYSYNLVIIILVMLLTYCNNKKYPWMFLFSGCDYSKVWLILFPLSHLLVTLCFIECTGWSFHGNGGCIHIKNVTASVRAEVADWVTRQFDLKTWSGKNDLSNKDNISSLWFYRQITALFLESIDTTRRVELYLPERE